MIKGFLEFLIGVFVTVLTLRFKELVNKEMFTIDNLKILLPLLLVVITGIIALYQMKSNIFVSYRIRWIENFKLNLSGYISETHLALFSLQIYSKDKENRKAYYDKYFEAINKSAMYRNRIFLDLDTKDDLQEKILLNIVDVNSLLDKFVNEDLSKDLELQISLKQTELEALILKLLNSEFVKNKNILHF